VRAEARLYDRLFSVPDPEAGEGDFTGLLNRESLIVLEGYVEPSVVQDPADTRYQFERLGYFWRDPLDSRSDHLVFNRVVALRDSWTKAEPQPARKPEAKPETESKPADLTITQEAASARLRTMGIGAAEATVLARDFQLMAYFEDATRHGDAVAIATWVVNTIGPAIRTGSVRVSPAQLAALVGLLQAGTINSRIARDVLAEALQTGGDPVEIVERKGLTQVSDASTIEPVVDRLITENPDKVRAFRNGKTALAGFFVGQVLRETQGRANPQLVQDLVARKLAGS
jgi:glutaminyl-tRNA synthetase